MKRLVVGLAVLVASPSARAQEPVRLDHLEAVRLGSASLVAGYDVERNEDAAAARDVYARLAGELASGSLRAGEFGPPALIGSHRFELGAFRKPGTTGDVDSRLFLYAPDGAHDGLAASGRHRFLGRLHGALDDLHVNLGLTVQIEHGSDGARGLRALDVAPAPYRRFTAAPSLWLTVAGDDDRYGVVLDYAIDDRRYLDRGPVRGARSHRAALAFGFRDDQHGHVGSLRFLSLGYVHSAAEAPEARPVHTTHQLDLGALEGRGHFGQRSDTAAYRFSRATVGVSLGWSFMWRELVPVSPSALGSPPTGATLHTPRMSLDVDYEDGEIGRFGGAVGHRSGLTPDGLEALGITFAELEGRLAPDDAPFGGSLAGTLARIEPLPLGERAARYHARADLEIFARLGLAEIGPRATLGHGVASGSMGWSLYGPQSWFGVVGGFVRLAGP